MADFNIRIRDDFNVHITWPPVSIGNCGMSVNSTFMCTAKGPVTTDSYGRTSYPGVLPAGLTARQVYDALAANLDKLLPQIPTSTGLVLITDRMAQPGAAIANPDTRTNLSLDTAFLMRALRKKKFGMIATSPLVENPNHPGASAIMGVFWVPPNKTQHILYEKIARSGVMTDEQIASSETRWRGSALKQSADAFTQDFYGRQG